MKRQLKTPAIIILITFASIASANLAPIAEVTFEKPESFNDFKTQTAHNKLDKSRLMQELQQQINEVAQRYLSNDRKLKINFLNIDMAGYIYPSIDDIRTIRQDADKSLLVFNYTILDNQGKVLDQGKERLIELNLNSMRHEAKRFKRSHFKYEMVMISRWLQKLSKTLLA
jgi:hypothetical protein